MATYEEVYADWKTLWDIGPASDMTGGYVDQEDLARLLRNPSKATAKRCLQSQIHYWFQKGPDTVSDGEISAEKAIKDNSAAKKVAIKYGYEDLV